MKYDTRALYVRSVELFYFPAKQLWRYLLCLLFVQAVANARIFVASWEFVHVSKQLIADSFLFLSCCKILCAVFLLSKEVRYCWITFKGCASGFVEAVLLLELGWQRLLKQVAVYFLSHFSVEKTWARLLVKRLEPEVIAYWKPLTTI